ncbi:DUF1482 family protein [Winslowiella toletana]|uniref:DUF1482 family protein n=1 Tax=Winslowiella toletana TaxID=92490 RepID=UPI0012FE81AB
MSRLFALIITVCPADGTTCVEALLNWYESKQFCEEEITEHRIFTGNCYSLDR